MADFAKKLTKAHSEVLLPKESLDAAVLAFPVGAISGRAMFGVASMMGGRVAEQVAKRRGGLANTAKTGMAAQLPSTRQVYLAVTSRRLLAFDASPLSNKPTELKAHMPLRNIAEIDVSKTKLGKRMSFRFTDGSTAEFDIARSMKTDEFVAAARQQRS